MQDPYNVMTEPPARGQVLDKRMFAIGSAALIIVFVLWFFAAVRPVAAAPAETKEFEISSGESFRDIANGLAASGVIKSAAAFEILALTTGRARRLQAGHYLLDPSKSASEILRDIVSGSVKEVTVTIFPGATLYDIDRILSGENISRSGELIAYASSSTTPLEGRLFPDTYRFFTNTPIRDVVSKMLSNFYTKAGALLAKSTDPGHVLTLASMLEKEVPDFEDRRVVAGILEKREKAGMPLQVDATVCYAKQIAAPGPVDCLPLTAIDLKITSPYNTYTQKGWPPGPIGNPGLEAIQAALRPQSSPYWYYLSDPKTHKTIFSAALDEHGENRAKYLR
jgi:UPF0755 protein